MNDNLKNLPEIDFINGITLDDVQEKMKADYIKKYHEITGKDIMPDRVDPLMFILYACSVQIFQAFTYADFVGKMNTLKYSYGPFLDNIAPLKGVERLPASAATVSVRFTLSGIRPSAISIPKGTRLTSEDAEVYFETMEYKEIPSGGTYIDVPCICQQTGIIGTAIEAGVINVLVDPIPYVASVRNIEISQGGTEAETDEALAYRAYIAPSKFSTAGPIGAYEYYVLSYSPAIVDVKVDSPNPVEVVIYFLLENGEIPSETTIRGLEAYLNNEDIKPLTDKVTVKTPTTENYNLNVKYWINSSEADQAVIIQSRVNEAINEYVKWQKEKIGRDLNPSELIKRVVSAGAKRCEVLEPSYQAISNSSIAVASGQTVTYGGLEHD